MSQMKWEGTHPESLGGLPSAGDGRPSALGSVFEDTKSCTGRRRDPPDLQGGVGDVEPSLTGRQILHLFVYLVTHSFDGL